MTNFNIPQVEITPDHIDEAFRIAAGQLLVEQATDNSFSPEIVSHGPPSWVAATPNRQDAEFALRLTHGSEPDSLLQTTQMNVTLMQDLRSVGAQVPHYFGKASIVKPTDIPGGFVATLANYLPGNQASFHEYGAAIASLHQASVEINIERIPRINPLAPVEKQVDYLKRRQEAGNPFYIGETELSALQLEALESHLKRGADMLSELFEMAESEGQPLVILQEDVHGQNVLQDKEGNATLIDIDPFKGPAALDFGRPLTDWHHRFGRSIVDTNDFIAGYQEAIQPEMMPDDHMLVLAANYINVRSSLILFHLAIDAVRTGHQGEEWMLRESIHRLTTINDRHVQWNGLDNAQKKALRELRGQDI